MTASRRTSSGGRHVATRAERPHAPQHRPAARVAKIAVAVALLVGAGGFAAATASGTAKPSWMAGGSERGAGAQEPTAASTRAAEYRTAVVDVALTAAEQATTVRAQSSSAVPAATLTQLDQAEAELDGLLAAAGEHPGPAPTASASADPTASAAPSGASTDTAVPAASPAAALAAVPTAVPTIPPAVAAAVAAVVPTVVPTAAPTAAPSQAPSASPTGSPAPASTTGAGPATQPAPGVSEPSPASTAPPSPSDPLTATESSLAALATAPPGGADAATTALHAAASTVATLTEQIEQADRDEHAAQSAVGAAAAAAADTARAAAEAAATRSAQRTSLARYANGYIPASALCGLTFAPAAQLRCDAAAAIEQLDTAYHQAFGVDMTIDASYRSYAAQVACRLTKGSVCAVPGTSNHGLGVAVDLGGGAQSVGTPQHGWLAAHAGAFGWMEPAWALPRGSKPEPWHWEFTG